MSPQQRPQQHGAAISDWRQAHFGDTGFYTAADLHLQEHFRTSCHVGGPLVATIAALMSETDQNLNHPPVFDVIDVGAGSGELIRALTWHLTEHEPQLARRTRFRAVDLRPRPAQIPESVAWIQGYAPTAVPQIEAGAILAFELLDDVPVGVADPGARVRFASELVSKLVSGRVLFVDYASDVIGTELVGYHDGTQTEPRFDGSMNVTAAVDFAELAECLRSFGNIRLRQQRDCISPTRAAQSVGLAGMQWRGQFAELTAMPGLGEHRWLIVERGEGPP